MRLTPWLDSRGRGSREALARSSGLSRVSISQAEKGLLSNVKVAKAIIAATDGAVGLADLTFAVEAGSRYEPGTRGPLPPKKKRLRAHLAR